MALKCNITKTGRVARLGVGLVAVLPAIALALSRQSLSLAIVVSIAGGSFALFEAAKGWCIVVHTLEKIRSGITKNRILRLLLGSSTEN